MISLATLEHKVLVVVGMVASVVVSEVSKIWGISMKFLNSSSEEALADSEDKDLVAEPGEEHQYGVLIWKLL